MKWAELATDWAASSARIRKRFPHLDDAALQSAQIDRQSFETNLARTHHLSLTEAREEVEDFLYIEKLTRELARLPV